MRGQEAAKLTRVLTSDGSPWYWRGSGAFVAVPNVSWGFLPWEADLLYCSKTGYLTEFEIKISASDWKADKKKRKFWARDMKGLEVAENWKRIRNFYYAAPPKLAERWQEFDIPQWAGVVAVNPDPEARFEDRVKYLKDCICNKDAEKLDDKGKAALARLGAIRVWTQKETQ